MGRRHHGHRMQGTPLLKPASTSLAMTQSIWSIGSDHPSQPSLPMCISDPWPPMTRSPVHHCSFLAPLLTDTDQQTRKTPGLRFERCSDPAIKLFLLLTIQLWMCLIAWWIPSVMMKRLLALFTSPVSSHNDALDGCMCNPGHNKSDWSVHEK